MYMAELGLQKLNHEKKEELWAKRIQECRNSGLGVQGWCAAQGLSHHTYYKWQQKLFPKHSSESETGFYEVNLRSAGSNAAIIVHMGVYSAEIYNGADEQTIQYALRALKIC